MLNSAKKSFATGIGVVTSAGIGKENFVNALQKGKPCFSTFEVNHGGKSYVYPIAKLEPFNLSEAISTLNLNENILEKVKRTRNLTWMQQYGLFSALEAWSDAGISEPNPDRTAVVVSGSNLQNNYFHEIYERYNTKFDFLKPVYGLNFLDSDLVGVISEILDIRGEGYTLGAASASGNMALIQAHRLICSGEYDVVLVVAPPMNLSAFEMQAFTSLGAMAIVTENVNKLCCPFDETHAGFVYGQMGGCIVLESKEYLSFRSKKHYGSITGYGVVLDANRNPNPSLEGEIKAMRKAIEMAGISPNDLDYINTHGTASVIGDKTEANAIIETGLNNKFVNSTKSLIGHGISSAGLVEAIACLIQMNRHFIHPTANLINPIADSINWVQNLISLKEISYSLNNSFGFGGINTSIVLEKNT